ncbi:hypothetical protein IB257_22200 [Achromobacter sp. ACM03]|uniref:hypothetical protein n=1 Tax=Achromobacter TaxID=222 RepID=UPI00177AEAED|nr:hypothetical protein [Achromobacter sp. ACM03]MBD9432662.1 hypothetical protein [Achromobacter sp. ACM03]
MATLNRETQLICLQRLAAEYPNEVNVDSWENEFPDCAVNLAYLHEHGLINATIVRPMSGPAQVVAACITAQGMDFLADDGGLGAILGVVTVRLHDDTIKAMIESTILQSDLPQPEKKRWLDQLRSLPAETTKHLVLKLVDKGLESGPAALAAVGTVLGMTS